MGRGNRLLGSGNLGHLDPHRAVGCVLPLRNVREDLGELVLVDRFLLEENVGYKPEVPINKKNADILFITPSGDVFADPAIYTLMGYFLLFDYLKKNHGFNWTMSAYASEGAEGR